MMKYIWKYLESTGQANTCRKYWNLAKKKYSYSYLKKIGASMNFCYSQMAKKCLASERFKVKWDLDLGRWDRLIFHKPILSDILPSNFKCS